jgi:hypothetical protein
MGTMFPSRIEELIPSTHALTAVPVHPFGGLFEDPPPNNGD